ncbi:MAG: hypothetical protein CFE24_15510 [Flavobacterium sp. BFFFF2]|nr:MAG: hypothetical protein CFE24_15510 [Flavobacterium sp. BFFFF2]
MATGFLFKHAFAIKTDGTLWGWGSNLNNVQGLPSNISQISTPTQIGTANNWSKVATGYYATKAIKTDGTLWISSATGFYQIGTDTDWNWVESGEAHFFAMKTNGTLWGQGGNDYGQLGLGSSIQGTSIPTQLDCTVFLGVEEVIASTNIKVYPNPTSHVVHINNGQSSFNSLSVYNNLGQLVLAQQLTNTDAINVDVSPFQEGIYLFKFQNEQTTQTVKVVKE